MIVAHSGDLMCENVDRCNALNNEWCECSYVYCEFCLVFLSTNVKECVEEKGVTLGKIIWKHIGEYHPAVAVICSLNGFFTLADWNRDGLNKDDISVKAVLRDIRTSEALDKSI